MASAKALPVGRSCIPLGCSSKPRQSLLSNAEIIPDLIGLVAVATRSRKQILSRALSFRSHFRSGAEQKTKASINGNLYLLRKAFCDASNDFNFLALLFAKINGLS